MYSTTLVDIISSMHIDVVRMYVHGTSIHILTSSWNHFIDGIMFKSPCHFYEWWKVHTCIIYTKYSNKLICHLWIHRWSIKFLLIFLFRKLVLFSHQILNQVIAYIIHMNCYNIVMCYLFGANNCQANVDSSHFLFIMLYIIITITLTVCPSWTHMEHGYINKDISIIIALLLLWLIHYYHSFHI